MKDVEKKYVTNSGIRRLYIKPYPLSAPLPTLISIVPSFEQKWFMEHVVMNHRGVLWITYRHMIDNNTYKIFMYAFAYMLYVKNPEDLTCWQVEANAKFFERMLFKLGISPSPSEKKVLDYSKKISMYSMYYNKHIVKEKSILLCELLRREYDW